MSTAASGRAHADDLGSTYDGEFFEELDGDVRASAGVIAPMIVDLLRPSSILDVGCGRGTWLHAFADLGVSDILGVDGPHVAAADLEIPAERFLARDLREPLDLGRSFDLVMSLEVAEHLAPDLGSTFVESLARHANTVLFSAAIPFQGGAGHVNEQWQSHWAAEFAKHGFVPVDAIRPRVWTDPHVAFWYAQNILLYVREGSAPELTSAPAMSTARLDIVHPDQYIRLRNDRKPMPPPSLRRLLHELPGACRRTLARRIGSGGSGRDE
jgi:SAM-dependent methyltransferase